MVDTSITLSSIPIRDYISFRQDASLMKLLVGARFFYADKMKKINSDKIFGKTQERTLVITDWGIYNIHGGEIKRAIDFAEMSALIKCVTPSTNKTEFTVQV